MTLPFSNLSEFIAARDKNEIDLRCCDAVLDRLNFKKLIAVLNKNYLLRLCALKKWFKRVGNICNIKAELKTSASGNKPYMTESGGVFIGKNDMHKPSYLFFAAAHETAHFILLKARNLRYVKE